MPVRTCEWPGCEQASRVHVGYPCGDGEYDCTEHFVEVRMLIGERPTGRVVCNTCSKDFLTSEVYFE